MKDLDTRVSSTNINNIFVVNTSDTFLLFRRPSLKEK